jgi:uncharacterized protein YegL
MKEGPLMSNRPGGELAKRPLQFIWLVDCSGSMKGKRIESLNFAIHECIKPMQDVADENPNAQILVRAIKFSNGAQWHISQPTDIHDFKWSDVSAEGVTDMGHALREVAKALELKSMPERGLPPVLVLLSDGMPTDDFNDGLKALMDQPWGRKSVRIAVAIGDDADEDVLRKFIGNNEIPPLTAKNPADLVKKMRWASTVPLKAASDPGTRTKGQPETGHVPVPAPPQDTAPPADPREWW